MISFAVFVFGLAVGSFLHSVIYRFEKGESALHGKSYCPRCKHTLVWYDLIPLLSFVVLKGRCRYCKEKISFQYPLVELATALVFVLLWHTLTESSFPQILELFYLWTMAAFFIAVFVYDLKHFLIPDKILYPAIGLAFLWKVFEFLNFDILNVAPLLAGLGTSIFFFTIYALSKGRAMGLGDVKLAFLLGLFLGWPSILVSLALAFFLGAVVGLVLIALQKKGLKSEVPFAPFLIAGTAIAFFFGNAILSWYLGLFLV